jgi:hypothetical protein
VRHNPCELQIDLFCSGMEIDPSCDLARDARGVSRTRAGLGSGLDLVLEGAPPFDKEVWVNVPLEEQFVAAAPFLLRYSNDRYEILDRRDDEIYPVRLPPEPKWYGRKTSSGLEMQHLGVLQGSYLGIYVGAACRFWQSEPKLNCGFCTTGLNIEASVPRTVDNVVEVALAAKEESGVTFVHLNTGYQSGAALTLMAPFVEALKKRVGVLVGVQAAPEGPFEQFDRLLDLGADHFSFCFEYFDPEFFKRLCPGKEKSIGQKRFFEALQYCQSRMPKGACSGEIVAGNEPLEKTLEAIDFITGVGAFPTVCIFRPLQDCRMEDWPSPSYRDMRRVMKHMWDRCRDHRISIGLAPNIEVSLVVQPTDAVYLSDGGWRDRWYLARNAIKRKLAGPVFRRRMAVQP